MLSFGGTKNGALCAEAVIFFDPGRAEEMKWRRKRAGQTLSKGRFLAAQFEGLLADDHWLDLARHANAMATRFADGLGRLGIDLAWPCQSNEVFPILPPSACSRLDAAGCRYLSWSATALGPRTAAGEGAIVGRFVMAFDTTVEDVDAALAALAG